MTASNAPSAERVAVAYVPDPKAKGLDVLVAGWAAAAVPDARLEVYGLDPERARSHLRRSGVPEPASLDLQGTVAADQFRARLRHARAYLAAARWEDWGQAPLEALADGALLATVPSGGPYEGLRAGAPAGPVTGGRARSTPPRSLPQSARPSRCRTSGRRAYRQNAAELLRPYRSEAVQETVTRELLPALLGGQTPSALQGV